jgi:hypothetical protein
LAGGGGGGGGGLTGPLTVSAVLLLGAFTPLSLFSMASIVADEGGGGAFYFKYVICMFKKVRYVYTF